MNRKINSEKEDREELKEFEDFEEKDDFDVEKLLKFNFSWESLLKFVFVIIVIGSIIYFSKLAYDSAAHVRHQPMLYF